MKIDYSLTMMHNEAKVPEVKEKQDIAKLREQTDKFESILIKTLLDTSMKFEDPLYGKDAGNKIYNSMYNEEIAKASSGGFGFSNMLFDYLSKKG